MFPIEEVSRRSTLKGLGFIQIFMGCTGIFGTIAALVIDTAMIRIWTGVLPKVLTSVFFIVLGVLAVRCARLDIPKPSRNALLGCIVINCIVAVVSCIFVCLVIVGLSMSSASDDVPDSSEPANCHDVVIMLAGLKAVMGMPVINIVISLPVNIAVVIFAYKMRKAAVPLASGAETAGYTAPHANQPVMPSGYSVVPVVPPPYSTATYNVDSDNVVHVKS